MSILTLFLTLTGLSALAQGEPGDGPEASTAAEIVVEEADVALTVELIGSGELARAASEVGPRLVFDHAAISWSTEVAPSPELIELAKETTPRIVVDHAAISFIGTLSGSEELDQVASQVAPRIVIVDAAISSLWQDLEGSAELEGVAYDVSPRILIEHAETGTLQALSPPKFVPPPPKPLILLWAVIGLGVGLLVGFLIWRLVG
jgi:hypothetical protein